MRRVLVVVLLVVGLAHAKLILGGRAETDAQLKAQGEAIAELKTLILGGQAQTSAQLKAQGEAIAGLKGAVAEQSTAIAGLKGASAEQSTAIAGLKGAFAEQSTAIAGLKGAFAAFDGARMQLNAAEMKAATSCATAAGIFLSNIGCTGFWYETSGGHRAVVTAAHCVADCAATAADGTPTCALHPTLPASIDAIHKVGGTLTNISCHFVAHFRNASALSPDVAVLDCGAEPPAGVQPLRRAPPTQLYSPVAIAGVATDAFKSGAHHYADRFSMRVVPTHLVPSAGTGVGVSATDGSVLLATGQKANSTFFDAAGFTFAQVTPGMSGGMVLDVHGGSCDVIGVAVASAQHGIYASLDCIDEHFAAAANSTSAPVAVTD